MADEMPEILRTMQPHRLTPLAAARMAVRHVVNPLTGRLTGERYVDPIVTSALAHHGIDPEPYARYLLAVEAGLPRDQGPDTMTDSGTSVSRDQQR